MLKSATCLAVVASAAWVSFRAYKDFMTNEVLVALTEVVTLPSSETQSFTDLSSTVSGEIRIFTNTLAVYKYLLRLNACFLEIAQNAAADGRRRVALEVPHNAVPLSDVVVNEIVETAPMEARQHLVFTPACVSQQALVQYVTRLDEGFTAPVAVRDCVARSVGSGQIQLSFALTIHAAVLDLELVICLPKKARAVHVSTGGVGTWKPSHASPRELIWTIGVCGTGSGRPSDVASLATVPSHVQEQQRKLFGQQTRSTHRESNESPQRLLSDETVVIPNLEEYPQAEYGRFMERIHFEMIYVIADEDDGNTSQYSTAGATAGKSHRKPQLGRVREEEVYAADPPPPPGVGLSYAIAATVSALTIKRLQVVDEKPTWIKSDRHWIWRAASLVLPSLDRVPKVCKKAQYTTRFSQTATVEVQY